MVSASAELLKTRKTKATFLYLYALHITNHPNVPFSPKQNEIFKAEEKLQFTDLLSVTFGRQFIKESIFGRKHTFRMIVYCSILFHSSFCVD
jgi:hypothetical protein